MCHALPQHKAVFRSQGFASKLVTSLLVSWPHLKPVPKHKMPTLIIQQFEGSTSPNSRTAQPVQTQTAKSETEGVVVPSLPWDLRAAPLLGELHSSCQKSAETFPKARLPRGVLRVLPCWGNWGLPGPWMEQLTAQVKRTAWAKESPKCGPRRLYCCKMQIVAEVPVPNGKLAAL